MYHTLTDYLPEIESDSFGKWIVDEDNKGTPENPIQMPYVSCSDMVKHFEKDVYNFQSGHPEYELNRYSDILRKNGIEWGIQSMQEADISTLDGKCIMALILGAIRSERFCSGALLSFFRNGTIAKWLLRLKEIDS